jgi:diguanylate cyclase (GGDEF)-like protein/PAS domain S-box-containing protein
VVTGLVLAGTYVALPRPAQGALTAVVGLVAAAALVRRGRRSGGAWLGLAAGVCGLVAGDLLVAADALRGVDTAFPGPADVAYLLAYPPLAWGVVRLAPGACGWVGDALAIVLGLAVPLWLAWGAPTVADVALGAPGAAVALAYPFGDAVLAVAAVPLLVAGGLRRRPDVACLLAAIALTFAADAVYGVQLLAGTYVPGAWPDVGWLWAHLLWAAAALAPAPGPAPARPAPARPAAAGAPGAVGPSPLRTTLLIGAVAAGPVVLAVQAVVGAPTRPWATLAVTVAVAALATRGGRALGHPRALLRRQTAVLVAAPAVLVLMAGGLAWLEHAGHRQAEAERVVLRLLAQVSELRAHEREAAAAAVVAPAETAHLLELVAEARDTVAALPATAVPPSDAATLRTRFRAYLQAGRAAFADDRTTDAGDAARLDAAQLTPAYEALHETALRVSGHVERSTRSAGRTTTLASATTLAVGLLTLVLLALSFNRAQRAAAAASAVRASEERLAALVGGSSDAIAVVGEDLRVLWQAASFEHVLGHPDGSLVGIPVIDLVHPEDRTPALAALAEHDSTRAFRVRHADGRWIDVEAVVNDRRDHPLLGGYVVNLRDVSERKALEARLHHQAFHDGLTGLPNWALFEDRLDQALRRVTRDGGRVGVVVCDLDDFKDVNDSLGHEVGDELLVAVAARLDGEVRGADTLARAGGDEFLLLLDDVERPEEAEQAAARVLAALRRPVTLGGREHVVRASVGVAVGGAGEWSSALLRRAETAMYAAKRQGGSAVQRFAEHMGEEAANRLRLRSELELALERGEFVVHYQPIVALGTGAVAGVEALVRWEHPERGLVPPDAFIPLAEQTGLIVPLGAWVLEPTWRAGAARPAVPPCTRA